jgi:SAM-dependent methyltransferase
VRGESLFDAQAPSFETRAGLAAPVRERIARALLDFGPFDPGRLILDVGAGSGDIGLELAQAGAAYLGIDESPAMLSIFRNRASAAGLRPELILADARLPWPVTPRTVGLVFGSRSLHFLDPAHVAAEARAAASPRGAAVVVGRVLRERDGVAARTRRAMRELLRREGYVGRSGSKHSASLLAECVARGATPLAPRAVATWAVRRSVRDSIDAWRSKPGLAGLQLPDDLKARLLDELEHVAAESADLGVSVESTEAYVLEGAAWAKVTTGKELP